MTQQSDEDQFRSLFGELKRGEDRLAPAFDPDRSTAGSNARPILSELRYGPLVAMALGMGTVSALVCVAWHPQHGRAPIAINPSPSQVNDGRSVELTAQTLSDWKSPTAFLLPSTDDWLGSADDPSGALPTTQPQARHSS